MVARYRYCIGGLTSCGGGPAEIPVSPFRSIPRETRGSSPIQLPGFCAFLLASFVCSSTDRSNCTQCFRKILCGFQQPKHPALRRASPAGHITQADDRAHQSPPIIPIQVQPGTQRVHALVQDGAEYVDDSEYH